MPLVSDKFSNVRPDAMRNGICTAFSQCRNGIRFVQWRYIPYLSALYDKETNNIAVIDWYYVIFTIFTIQLAYFLTQSHAYVIIVSKFLWLQSMRTVNWNAYCSLVWKLHKDIFSPIMKISTIAVEIGISDVTSKYVSKHLWLVFIYKLWHDKYDCHVRVCRWKLATRPGNIYLECMVTNAWRNWWFYVWA